MKNNIFLMLFILVGFGFAQVSVKNINEEFSKGNFKKVEELINKKLSENNVSSEEKLDLEYKKDLMQRIRLDFKRSEEDVIKALKKYYPDITSKDLVKWEKDKSLEMMYIDGEKKYFNSAVPNLFRKNKEARLQREKIDGLTVNKGNEFLSKFLPQEVSDKKSKGEFQPIKMRLKYTVTLKKNIVPEGEIIRAWLPYPKEGYENQRNVKMINVNDDKYLIADNDALQRSIYIEKKVVKDEDLKFYVEYEFDSYSDWKNLKADDVKDYNKNSEIFKKYTVEEKPHIVFTDKIKKLSQEINGNETNPYNKVVKIVEWITINIPWTSAREYSTLENIPDYCLSNMQGDCGIKSLLFITLARCAGIPAKWQSGWMLHPYTVTMHDWAQVYFENIGWVHVDPDFGIQPTEDVDVRNFYTNGMDPYRLIVNDDIAIPLYPAKIYPRSEPYDFQRGELEWRGGNLYFDKWNYNMDVEYVKN
ncbi:MAG TPA: transglutaminase-like domain-containing protein [Ignavibacteriaceae bacterium]|nr:transglutaminase-like domain-containing protein [Ignavibacteriaceae bacterium]